MRELENISVSLFEKIRARFDNISIGDEKANRTSNPESARFFNFDYVGSDGKNYGNITISLIDEDSLKVYYGVNISNDMDDDHKRAWFNFLKDLRKFAKRNMLNFEVRDINRSNLNLQNLKQQSSADGTWDAEDIVSEAKLYGDNRDKHTSYTDQGEHRIVIKHRESVDPDKHGARSRNIDRVFVETPLGERFLLDYKNLHGARALAHHLNNGGTINDSTSEMISEMVKEMASMQHFARNMRNRTFEDAETTSMVGAALGRYEQVKEMLQKAKGRNGYARLLDMAENYAKPENDIDVDELRERFVRKIYDDRFNDALPYVHRAYTNQFEEWATDVTEETFGPGATDELTELFDEPITIGIDGQDAIATLSGISFVDNDQLINQLIQLSKQGPDQDARPLIANWLAENGEQELAQELEAILQSQAVNTTAPAPQPKAPPADTYAASTMPAGNTAPAGVGTISEDEDLTMIRWLSGLGKK